MSVAAVGGFRNAGVPSPESWESGEAERGEPPRDRETRGELPRN